MRAAVIIVTNQESLLPETLFVKQVPSLYRLARLLSFEYEFVTKKKPNNITIVYDSSKNSTRIHIKMRELIGAICKKQPVICFQAPAETAYVKEALKQYYMPEHIHILTAGFYFQLIDREC